MPLGPEVPTRGEMKGGQSQLCHWTSCVILDGALGLRLLEIGL